MSRPRFYWYGIARKMVMQYPRYKTGVKSVQEQRFADAIEKVYNETASLPDGKARALAIDEILFKKTSTYEGIGQRLHYDWRTIQNWINKFINSVGKEAGF